MENDYENIIFLYNFVFIKIDNIVDVGSVQKCTARVKDYSDAIWAIAGIGAAVG